MCRASPSSAFFSTGVASVHFYVFDVLRELRSLAARIDRRASISCTRGSCRYEKTINSNEAGGWAGTRRKADHDASSARQALIRAGSLCHQIRGIERVWRRPGRNIARGAHLTHADGSVASRQFYRPVLK